MRMDFSDPRSNILQIGLREGMKVGDIGAGSGHYALAAGNIVGKDGRVYAIDIQEDMLKHIKDAAAEHGLANVDALWGNAERQGGTTLRDHVLDAAILSNVLFQIDDRAQAAAEAKRILRPGGKLLVVDWAGSYGGIGPDPARVISEYVAEDLFIGAGFHKVKDFRAGPHHYGIVFTAP